MVKNGCFTRAWANSNGDRTGALHTSLHEVCIRERIPSFALERPCAWHNHDAERSRLHLHYYSIASSIVSRRIGQTGFSFAIHEAGGCKGASKGRGSSKLTHSFYMAQSLLYYQSADNLDKVVKMNQHERDFLTP